MPPNNLTEMILGFVIILGILIFYSFTLILRFHNFRKKGNSKNNE